MKHVVKQLMSESCGKTEKKEKLLHQLYIQDRTIYIINIFEKNVDISCTGRYIW